MTKSTGPPRFDLEERTFELAKAGSCVRKRMPRTVCNIEDVRQLVRASGSVGANYIEANEALGKKDFRMRIRICRKEAKECGYWPRLLDTGTSAGIQVEQSALVQESAELTKIFGAILRKSE